MSIFSDFDMKRFAALRAGQARGKTDALDAEHIGHRRIDFFFKMVRKTGLRAL